jgi:predicted molibdopterin-dependent oxidoreductase YjgC
VTNLEGRVQPFDPVVPPPGNARADWELLDLLAARLGAGTPYESLTNIRKEIRKLVPMYAALSVAGEAWLENVSTKALFNSNGRGELIAFYPVVSTEGKPVDDAYPFTAIVGTQRYQLGSGTRSSASERIQELASAGKIEISPRDAADFNLVEGSTVVVSSRHGRVTRAVHLKSGISPGHIFVPTGVNRNEAMNLFDLSDLTTPGAAGWKTCEVKLEKA